MSNGSLTPDQFATEMREASEKFDVVPSDARTLLLDLDTEAALEQFGRVLPKVREHFAVGEVETWHSKSGNTHVKITLFAPLTFTMRVALQAALGSDGVREVLSLVRFTNGIDEPSRLFRPRVAEATA